MIRTLTAAVFVVLIATSAQAQQRVEHCYDQMLSQGYFRDPYNNWDVLWQFGLSWWTDVIPMLDKEARLSVPQAKLLLEMPQERQGTFEERVEALRAEHEAYFPQALGRIASVSEPGHCAGRAD